jgi:hypothetical protein
MKIYKLIVYGHILLSVPFIILLAVFYINPTFTSDFLIIFTFVGFLFWSGATPIYKSYCIKKINNQSEYFMWKRICTNTLLFWPNNFLFNQLEFWNEKRLIEYNSKVKSILN